jgi:hypothetical protein
MRLFLNKVIEREKREIEQGRVVFFHGCKWSHDLAQDIATRLWEVEKNKKLQDYRFVRFDRPITNGIRLLIDRFFHNVVVQRGLQRVTDSNLLFCTSALFSGSSSMDNAFCYWFNNDACRHRNSGLDAIFGANPLYKRHKKAFNKLEKLHRKAANKGMLLLISLTPEMASSLVYRNGFRLGKNHSERGYMTLGFTATSDPNKIIQAVKDSRFDADQVDDIQYCMVLDGAQGGVFDLQTIERGEVKIYPFHTALPNEYADYCKARDALFATIAQELALEPSIMMGAQ